MNSKKVREVIKLYKQHFKVIHKGEIYKWRAVKCFQDNWDITVDDYLEMLERSLHLAKNLLDSGQYFPKRMLLKSAAISPELFRQLFTELYDEDNDLIERITNFQAKIKAHNKKHFPGKNDFQDKRAVLFYLCLRFPDRYYLYKYKMFKDFVSWIDYPYEPKRGDIENILQYLTMCNLLKEELLRDTELLDIHQKRLTESEFVDTSFNILTQDIIYSVQYIKRIEQSGAQEPAMKRLIKVDRKVSPKAERVKLKGSFTNYIENEKEKKRIGDLGELLVLQREQEKLKSFGISKRPEHKSKSEGDGLGYDILSYDKQGEEIYIEVKTTAHNYDTPFYITANELEKSKQSKDQYFLYRLYEYDDTNNKAKYYERQGEMNGLCSNPILYRAIVEK